MKQLSLYYRCQLVGWGSYFIVNYLASIAYLIQFGYAPGYSRIFFTLAITVVIGFLTSHLVRSILKKLQFFTIPVEKQAIYFVIIALVGSYVFAIAIIFIGDLTKVEVLRSLFNKKILLYVTQYVYGGTAFPFISWLLIYFLVHFVKQQKLIQSEKTVSEKKILELKRKNLRAQMNPRFVLESIGILSRFVREGHTEKAIIHLTNYSKLIRILLVSAEKDEISVFEEVELCKYYLRMEQLKAGENFEYQILISGTVDLKSYFITPLFIQSFLGRIIKEGSLSVKIEIVRIDGKIQIKVLGENFINQNDGVPAMSLLKADKNSLTFWKLDHVNLSEKWVYNIDPENGRVFCLTLKYLDDE